MEFWNSKLFAATFAFTHRRIRRSAPSFFPFCPVISTSIGVSPLMRQAIKSELVPARRVSRIFLWPQSGHNRVRWWRSRHPITAQFYLAALSRAVPCDRGCLIKTIYKLQKKILAAFLWAAGISTWLVTLRANLYQIYEEKKLAGFLCAGRD